MIALNDFQQEKLVRDVEYINSHGHKVEIIWEYFGENTAKVEYDGKPVSIVYNYDSLRIVMDVLFMLSMY